MSTAWRAGLIAALALATLGGVLYAILAQPPAPTAELPAALAGEPDVYMRDATITQYAATGRVKYRLASTRLRYFERDALTRLIDPDLWLYNETQQPWQIRAAHGYVRQSTLRREAEEVIFLRDRVVVSQRYADGRHIRMRSPALYLYPDRQYAETDQDVMIDTDVGRTKAVGLQGDLQRGLLTLFSSADQRVHTIVLPGQFK